MEIGESKLRYETKPAMLRNKRKVKSMYKNVSHEVKQSQSARTYLFNFFLFASAGCLFPYLPIFFKLLGLNPLQNGILTAVRGLSTLWSGPIMGSFRHLPVFTNAAVFICTVGFVIDTFSLALVQDGLRGGLPYNKSLCHSKVELTPNYTLNISIQGDNTERTFTSLLELERGFTKIRRAIAGEMDEHSGRGLLSGREHNSLGDNVEPLEPSQMAGRPWHHHGSRRPDKGVVHHRLLRKRTRPVQRKRLRRFHSKKRRVHHLGRSRLGHHNLKRKPHHKAHLRPHHQTRHHSTVNQIPTKLFPSHHTSNHKAINKSHKKAKASKRRFTKSPLTTSESSEGTRATPLKVKPTYNTPNKTSGSEGHLPTNLVRPKLASTHYPIILPSHMPSNDSERDKIGKVNVFLKNAKDALTKDFPMPKLFLSCVIITVISEFFFSILCYKSELVDEVARYFCPSVFAMNRLWGRIGYSVSAFLTAYLSWRLTCSYTSSSTFYFHFYGFLVGGGFVLFTTLCLPMKRKAKQKFCEDWCKPWKLLLCNLKAFTFSTTLIIIGTVDFIFDAYLLWHVYDLGGTELMLGIVVTTAIVTDVMFYCFIGISVQWIGHAGLLSVSVLVSGAHFMGLYYIQDPWLLIPLQILRGIATAGSKSALFDFSNAISPLGMENAVHSLLQSIYAGIGVGIGGLSLSLAHALYGPKMLFGGMSAVCFVYGTMYSLVSLIHFTVYPGKRYSGQSYEKVQPDVVPENDWLVDALDQAGRSEEG